VWAQPPSAVRRSEAPPLKPEAESRSRKVQPHLPLLKPLSINFPRARDLSNPTPRQSFVHSSRSRLRRTPCAAPVHETLPHSDGTRPTARSPDSKPANNSAIRLCRSCAQKRSSPARTMSGSPCVSKNCSCTTVKNPPEQAANHLIVHRTNADCRVITNKA